LCRKEGLILRLVGQKIEKCCLEKEANKKLKLSFDTRVKRVKEDESVQTVTSGPRDGDIAQW
jgi:hypothetical protein